MVKAPEVVLASDQNAARRSRLSRREVISFAIDGKAKAAVSPDFSNGALAEAI